MAPNANSVRGDGLLSAHRKLLEIEEYLLQIEQARVRLDEPPPTYISGYSEEERKYRVRQLAEEHHASTCRNQFGQQKHEEWENIIQATENESEDIPIGKAFVELAYERVKKRWNEQGLWHHKWNRFDVGLWKHEEPTQLESEPEPDSDTSSISPLLLFGQRKDSRRTKSKKPKQRDSEFRPRNREASRPYYQFVYQMSKERDRIQEKLAGDREKYADDINTQAYNNVQATWRRRKIWNEKWGTMPGMSWKHERKWEEVLAEAGLQPNLTEGQAAMPAPRPEVGSRSNPFAFTFPHHTQDSEPAFDALNGSSLPTHTALESFARPFSQNDNFPRWSATALTAPHRSRAATRSSRGGTEALEVNSLFNSDIDGVHNALDTNASWQLQPTAAAAHKQLQKPKPWWSTKIIQPPEPISNTTSRAPHSSKVSKAVTTTRKKLPSAQKSRVYQEALHTDINRPPSQSLIDHEPPRKRVRMQQSKACRDDGAQRVASRLCLKQTVASSAKSDSSAKRHDY